MAADGSIRREAGLVEGECGVGKSSDGLPMVGEVEEKKKGVCGVLVAQGGPMAQRGVDGFGEGVVSCDVECN